MAGKGEAEAPPSPSGGGGNPQPQLFAVSPAFKCTDIPVGATIRHDNFSQELIVLHENMVQICPIYSPGSLTAKCAQFRNINSSNLDSNTYVLTSTKSVKLESAKRSLKRSWLAVGVSDYELLFYHLDHQTNSPRGSPTAQVSLKPYAQYTIREVAGRKRIPGYYWLNDVHILLVTSNMLEILKLGGDGPKKNKKLKRVTHFATTTDSHAFFLPEDQDQNRSCLLLSRNHAKPNVIKVFKVKQVLHKLAKIILEQSSTMYQPENTQMGLYRIHGQRYLVLLDTMHNEVTLFYYDNRDELFQKEAVIRIKTFGTDPASGVSVSDNLLLIHCAKARSTAVLDVKKAPDQEKPFLNGRGAIGFRSVQIEEGGEVGNTSLTSAGSASHEACLQSPHPPNLYNDVMLLPPDLVLHFPTGRVYHIMLNVPELARGIKEQGTRLDFILRRRGARPLILSAIQKLMHDRAPLSALATVFNKINHAIHIYLTYDQRRRHGMAALHAPTSTGGGGGITSPAGGGGGVSFSVQPFEDGLVDAGGDGGIVDEHSPNISPRSPKGASPAGKGEKEEKSFVASLLGNVGGRLISAGNISEPSGPLCQITFAGAQLSETKLQSGQGAQNSFPTPNDAEKLKSTGVYANIYDPEDWMTSLGYQMIQQIDIYKEVFFHIHEEKILPPRYFAAAFMDYVRSLAAYQIPLQDFMHRFMIDVLIYSEPPQYHKLHQYLQYHVIEDHVPIAFQLLKFERRYPPSFQLALDMLARMKKYDEIVEVMLSCGMLVKAVEIMIQYRVKKVQPRYILENALGTGDEELFFNVYHLLRRFNGEIRGSTSFRREDGCSGFDTKNDELFKTPWEATRSAVHACQSGTLVWTTN